MIYIDADLKTYRCTYTVGNKNFSTGTLENQDKLSGWYKHMLLNLPECLACPLGGYCSGGCRISSVINPKLRCQEEKASFDFFVKQVLIPWLKQSES